MNIPADELKRVIFDNVPEAEPGSAGREIIFRCRFCGDSDNPNHKHFYMSLPTADTPSLFRCWKCNARGVTTPQMLASIGIIDPAFSVSLGLYNAQVLSYAKNTKYRAVTYRLNNTLITDSEMSRAKLGYINKRLGLSLSYNDLLQNKIVLNLSDLFKCNPKLTPSRAPQIMTELDGAFLGFISIDNCFLNMKNLMPGQVSEPIQRKYINYVIFDKYDNTQKYYVPPVTINLALPGKIKLHIAEGSFDILSVKFNCRKEIRQNIYSSIGGNSYLNILMTYVSMYGLINLEPHIYLDNDVDDISLAGAMIDQFGPYGMDIYFHKNVFPGEKDFGVHPSHIKEEIYKIT